MKVYLIDKKYNSLLIFDNLERAITHINESIKGTPFLLVHEELPVIPFYGGQSEISMKDFFHNAYGIKIP
jgi:hypothetical protein